MPDIQLRPDIIFPHDKGKDGKMIPPDSSEYDWHFLAEGDSWFSIGALPSSNLIFEMRFRKWTQILNLAYPGDTIKHYSEWRDNPDLNKFLAKKRFNYAFDALLLSGGGNDLIDLAPQLISGKAGKGKASTQPDDYIDQTQLVQLLSDIQQAYGKVIALRDSKDSLSKQAPAFVHTYDYATPRNAPVTFLGAIRVQGPWLFKAFKDTGIEPKMQQLISDRLMDSLANALLELDSSNTTSGKALPNFNVIDTRNILTRANATEVGNSNDWINEIHPNHDGYRKVADHISQRINQVLS